MEPSEIQPDRLRSGMTSDHLRPNGLVSVYLTFRWQLQIPASQRSPSFVYCNQCVDHKNISGGHDVYSVGDAKKRLHRDYVAMLYRMYPRKYDDAVPPVSGRPLHTCLRVNTLKTDRSHVMQNLQRAGVRFQSVAWLPDAFVLQEKMERALQKLPVYETGQIYLQSLASQVPPLLLGLTSSQRHILDLCAAPGSKTSQIAALAHPNARITAVEIDEIRTETLRYNLDKLGANNVTIQTMDGRSFGKRNQQQFDAVLVDAPCSGEARFRLDNPRTYSSWRGKLVRESVKLQRRLLHAGLDALRPEGILVYSTCTINPEENEGILAKILTERNDVEILPTTLPGLKSTNGQIVQARQRLPKSVGNAMRIWPTAQIEGFFCAVLRKAKDDDR